MAETEQLAWAVFTEDSTTSEEVTTKEWWSSRHTVNPVQEDSSTQDKNVDDWQDFSSSSITRKPVSSHKHLNGILSEEKEEISESIVNGVIEECFPLELHSSTRLTSDPLLDLTSLNNDSVLSELHTTSVSLTNFEWSRCLIKDQFFLSLLADNEETTVDSDDLDLSGFDEFDWSLPESNEKIRHESIDSESGGVRFSPQDEFQGLFRPPGRIDSPIELEFDHDKAVTGLSMLPVADLTMMRDEMAGKVSKLSNELVSLLQARDLLQLETVTKNRFIQAMLKVQESKHAMQNTDSNTLTSSMGVPGSGGDNGGGGEGTRGGGGPQASSNGDEVRTKRRSRSLSFQNLSRSLIAKAKNLRTVEEDKTSSDVLLRVVIPYKQETAKASFSVPLLKQWTKILLAMAEKNPNVPQLISDYLTTAIEDSQINADIETRDSIRPPDTHTDLNSTEPETRGQAIVQPETHTHTNPDSQTKDFTLQAKRNVDSDDTSNDKSDELELI